MARFIAPVRALGRRLVHEEDGFTLLELLNAILILLILLAIAMPNYLRLRDNADKAAATQNAKSLALAAQVYAQTNYSGSPHDPDAASSTSDEGFEGMTMAELLALAPGLSSGSYVNASGTEASGVSPHVTLDSGHYCIYTKAASWFAYQVDLDGSIKVTNSASLVCT